MKALITGASSGLGREIAYYLSDLDYDLILVSRDKKELEETKKHCKKETKVYVCDLSKIDNIKKLYVDNKNESIDFLVNAAGFGLFGKFHETSLETELDMINVNISAVHILTKLFLMDFIKKDNGYIMNVASIAGFMSGPGLSTYYSSKNYVVKQTTAIYEELHQMKSNVGISVFCPGPFDSNFNKIAGGSFKNKGTDAKKLAKISVDETLKKKMIIIPGFKWKLAVFGSRFIPYRLAMKIAGNFQLHKQKDQ